MAGNIYPKSVDRTFLDKVSNFPDTVYSFNPNDNLTALMETLLGAAGTGQLTLAQLSASNTQDLSGMEYSDLDEIPGAILRSGRLPSEQYSINTNPFVDQLNSSQWDSVLSADSAYRERLSMMFTAINNGATVLGITLLSEAILGCKVRVLEAWRYNSTIATATASGSVWTFGAPNNFSPGQNIIISNNSISNYNGTWTVATANASQFTINNTSSPPIGYGGSATSLTNYSSLFKTSSPSEFAIVPLNDAPLTQQLIGNLAESIQLLCPANSIVTIATQSFLDPSSIFQYDPYTISSISSASGGPLGYTWSVTAPGSNFTTGQPISISGITGATGFNGSYTVASGGSSNFTIYSSTNPSGTPGYVGSLAISNIIKDNNVTLNYLGASVKESTYNSIPSGTTITSISPSTSNGTFTLSAAPTFYPSFAGSNVLTINVAAYEVPIGIKQIVADSEWFEFDKIVTVGKVSPNLTSVTDATLTSQYWVNPNYAVTAPQFSHMSTSEEEISLVSNIASVNAIIYPDPTNTSKKHQISPKGVSRNVSGGTTYSSWIQVPLADSPDNFPNGKYPGDPNHYTSFSTTYSGSGQSTFASLTTNGFPISTITNVSSTGTGTVTADDGTVYTFTYSGITSSTLTGCVFNGPNSATVSNNNVVNLSLAYNYEWPSQSAYVSYLTGLVTKNGGQFNSNNTQYRLPTGTKFDSVSPISLQQVVLPPSLNVVGTVYGGQ